MVVCKNIKGNPRTELVDKLGDLSLAELDTSESDTSLSDVEAPGPSKRSRDRNW